MKKHILKVWMMIAIGFLAVEVAGQVAYVTDYPSVSGIGENSVTLEVQVDQSISGLRSYYVVLESSEPAPTIAEVEDGFNYSTGEPFAIKGVLYLHSTTEVKTASILDLLAETSYSVYLYTRNNDGSIAIETTNPSTVSFSTLSPPEPLSYSINYPLISDVSTNSSTLEIQVNQSVSGLRSYYVVLESTEPAPSIAEVEDGFNYSTGEPFDKSGTIYLHLTTEVKAASVLNLLPETSYTVYLYTRNNDGSIIIETANPSTVSFSTNIYLPPPAIIENGYSPAPNSVEVSRNPVWELTFNEDIVKGDAGYFRIFTIINNEEEEIYPVPRSQVTVLENDNKLTVSLNNFTLEYGTQYYIKIDPGFVKSALTGADFEGISSPTEWSFTTESSPPIWKNGYPSITNQTMTNFVFSAWADLTGAYFGVVTQSATAPTAEQISQGLNQGGTAARIDFNDIVSDNSVASTQTVLFNSETPLGSPYYLHAVYRNGTKYSEVRTFTIDRIVPQILSSNPSNGLIVFEVGSPLSISFNEPVVGSDRNALTTAYFSLVKNVDTAESVPVGFSVETVSEITTVTITPTLPLDANASYTLNISPVYDLNGNISAEIIISFETDVLSTWTGGGNASNWSDPLNWPSGYESGKSVVISGSSSSFPTIVPDDVVSVHNLTVMPAAVLTQTGGVLNVTGEFHLQSSSERNASYFPLGGDLNVGNDKVFVHQVIPVPNDKWVFLMGAPTLGADALNSGSGFQMRWYDNTTDTWNNNNLNKMLSGVGYSVSANNDLVFRGQINRATVQPAITRTDGQGFGWNVLGNPFTASLNWSDIVNEVDNPDILNLIENSFWLWNPSQSIYNAFNQDAGVGIELDGTIPSNHGFLVKVKIGKTGGNINLKSNALVVNSENYLKSTTTPRQYLKIKAGNEDFEDKLAVVFIDEATNGVDKYDSEKRFGGGKNPFEIYTLAADNRLTINSFPFVNNKEIALGFSALKTGEYTVELSDIAFDDVDVLLLDHEVGTVTNLTSGESYTFSVATTGINNSRFSLRFSAGITTAVNLDTFGGVPHFSVFTKDRHIFVQSAGSLSGANYQVRDLTGRTVLSGILDEEGINDLGTFKTGVYLVTIIGDTKITKTQKVVVY